jgi:hypothetical protein
MILTAENYYSHEANQEFFSVSQFKSFEKCEAAAMAELNGTYIEPMSTALLVGSYVDAYFEGTLDLFKAKHPELLKKDGGLKSDYVQAEKIIQRIEQDNLFIGLLGGEKQVIMTGEIEGIPFKIKVDSYLEGSAIVDLKVMKDFEKIWNPEKRQREHFVEFYGYDVQGAVYQEIVRQNTGKRLPFYIVATTKESEADLAAMEVNQERLNVCLEYVKTNLIRMVEVKSGLSEPSRCEKCDHCKRTKVLTEIVDYTKI